MEVTVTLETLMVAEIAKLVVMVEIVIGTALDRVGLIGVRDKIHKVGGVEVVDLTLQLLIMEPMVNKVL
jgi:C-terminal processing protease CtpA/Prc